jgi:membrane protein implicated in regulation of membrane protease activity
LKVHAPVWPAAAVLGVGLALVFLAGVGSGRSLVHAGGSRAVVHVHGSLLLDLTTVVFVAASAVVGLLVYVLWPGRVRRRKRDEDDAEEVPEDPTTPLAKVLGILVALLVLAVPIVLAVALARPNHRRQPLPTPHTTTAGQPSHAHTATPPSTHAASTTPNWWFVLGALVLLVLAAVGTMLLLRRRRSAVPVDEQEAREKADLTGALALSLADVEREPDPRRAVIKAYARMEAGLARHGLPRRSVETSLEYVSRALLGLRVSGPAVDRLGRLFERAKFSQHTVDTSMKGEALAALGQVKIELEEST